MWVHILRHIRDFPGSSVLKTLCFPFLPRGTCSISGQETKILNAMHLGHTSCTYSVMLGRKKERLDRLFSTLASLQRLIKCKSQGGDETWESVFKQLARWLSLTPIWESQARRDQSSKCSPGCTLESPEDLVNKKMAPLGLPWQSSG